MPSRKVEFEGHSGAALAARLDLPAGRPRACALFAHCFTCSKDIAAARRIAGRLTAEGYAVLRFDFTGLGHSEGEFGNSGFAGDVADLLSAAAWMNDNGMPPALVIGHSLGGAAALAAMPEITQARAVAVIGAPADPAHVLKHLGAARETIEAEGAAEVRIAGRPFTVKRSLIRDTEAADLKARLARLDRALLILHAPRDETVGVDNATEIFSAARHPKSFVSLDDADHLLTRPADADYAAGVIAAWARRYVAMEDADREAAPEGVVRATEADPEGFRQDILAGPHALAADEPEDVGGTDTAPSPYGLVSAGLAACTSMTVRMYARRKGWPLDGVSVDVRHGKVHAEDCAECEEREGKIDRFERLLRLEGDLSSDQRARLMEIADKCPVHRTLEAKAVITTQEV
jgi:putative redox protein